MKNLCRLRVMKVLAGGMVLLQTTGCTWEEFNAFVQTILLGITAAGGVAILQNV
jgi:hypothetical protein